jgi:hypothetical protein
VGPKSGSKPLSEPFALLRQFWKTPVEFPWGTADASSASSGVRAGNRLVPNRVVITTSGIDGQPKLRLELEAIDGIPECRQLSISSVASGRAVRQVDLDSIKLNEWVADSFAAFAFERRDSGFIRIEGGPAGSAQDIHAANDFQRARRGKGARIVNQQVIEEAVEIYKRNIRHGAIQAIADAFGVSTRTASSWITRARTDEFGNLLPPTKPGQKKVWDA